MKRRVFRVFGIVIGVVLLLFLGVYLAARHPMPTVLEGPGAHTVAEGRARAMMLAVDYEAWTRTGAIRWTSRRGTSHLWDRTRNFDRVSFGRDTVLLDLAHRSGIARRNGLLLSGGESARCVEQAWKLWANDSFWLNPVAKLFDSGTSLAAATVEGSLALRVRYSTGGITPGDTYVWILGPDGRPTRWRMWVSIIPIPGLEVSWQGWHRLSTGAWISTEHHMGPLPITLTNISAAETLAVLVPGPDPFAAIAP